MHAHVLPFRVLKGALSKQAASTEPVEAAKALNPGSLTRDP